MNLPLPETKCRLCGNHGSLLAGLCQDCLAMPKPADRFKTLAEEARPMQDRLSEIAFEQMQLSHQVSIDLLREAFPTAICKAHQVIAEIKPTDMANGTRAVITKVKEAGLEPTEILIDDRRKVITLVR